MSPTASGVRALQQHAQPAIPAHTLRQGVALGLPVGALQPHLDGRHRNRMKFNELGECLGILYIRL